LNTFLKNIFTLSSGTILSQAIPIGLLPILSRIYSPEEFGSLALFIAIYSTLSVFVTGRYELSIMLPDDEKDALSIFQLASLLTLLISILTALIIFYFSQDISVFFNNNDLKNWLYFIPLSIFIAGLYQSISYWLNRKKFFNKMAYMKIFNSTSISIFQLILGIFSKLNNSLIIGHFSGALFTTILFIKKIIFENKHDFLKIDFKRIKKNAIQYKRFPLISSISSLLDKSAVQMPIFFISKFFDQASVGLFSLLTKFLDAPFAILNQSINLVLFERVVDLSKNDPEKLRLLILRIFISLLLISSPFILITYFFGSEIFYFLLGPNWGEVGSYAFLLMIVVGYRFSISPLSAVLSLNKTLHIGAIWQTVYFLSIFLTLYLFRNLSFYNFLLVFTLHEIILYTIYLLMIFYSCDPKRF
tara:strand:+ start:4934 stop:6181 length:1248 start_codon:yes stop_codon:yes gene_type:complete